MDAQIVSVPTSVWVVAGNESKPEAGCPRHGLFGIVAQRCDDTKNL